MRSGRYVEQGKGQMINMGEEEIENQPLEADLFCHYHSHGVEAQCIAWILMSLNILYIWRCNWYHSHMGVPDVDVGAIVIPPERMCVCCSITAVPPACVCTFAKIHVM